MLMRLWGLLLLLTVPCSAESLLPIDSPEWVVVLEDPRPPRQRGWAAGVSYAGSARYEEHPALARLADAIASEYALSVAEQWPVRSLGLHCLRVSLDQPDAGILERLERDPRVRWVQPLNSFEGSSSGGSSSSTAAARHYRELQTSLDILNLGALHDSLQGRGVSVAVIDSAVERDHPDLRGSLRDYRDFVPGRGLSRGERHGTGIAAVIAAADNGVGITGVSPAAKLHIYRACWESAEGKTVCDSLSLSRALDRAVLLSPQLLNLSLTGPEDRLLESLLQRLLERGTLVVAAFDEKRREDARFPAPAPGVLYASADGAGDPARRAALAAPGQQVLTAQPGQGWDYMEGHSLAAAHVSGVLALMLEANPDISHETARSALRESMGEGGSSGSIDACLALMRVSPDLGCAARGLAYRSW